jgi:hypothetical protein
VVNVSPSTTTGHGTSPSWAIPATINGRIAWPKMLGALALFTNCVMSSLLPPDSSMSSSTEEPPPQPVARTSIQAIRDVRMVPASRDRARFTRETRVRAVYAPRMQGRTALAALALAACGEGPPAVELPTSDRTDLAAVGLITERCSSAAIDVGGPEDAPAYLLTAGHCTGFGQILHPHVIDYPDPSLGTVHFAQFTDTELTPIDVEILDREYATLLGADLGVYRLDATVAELRARGIEPIALADTVPAPGEAIAMAGFPGTTDEDPRRVLHLSHCEQGDTTRLAEGDIVFIDFLQNDCQSIRGGSSGGPVFDDDGRIFAVTSTGTFDAESPCQINHPCEVEGDPLVTDEGAIYGAPIGGLAQCFVDGVFDIEAAGCTLTRPQLPIVEGDGPYTSTTAWAVMLGDAGLPYYRIKTGYATEVRCEDDDGFGAPIAFADDPAITDYLSPVPTDAPEVLCIQGMADPTDTARDRFLERTTMLQVLR